jgi:hypothetical protein
VGKAPDQQPEPFLPDMRSSANLIYWLVSAFGMTVLPFVRQGFGKHGIGLPGLLAGAIIWLYAGLADAPEMLTYFVVWAAFCIYRRMTHDPRQHTQYQGYPLLTGWLFKSEMTARLAEAGLVWIAGGILSGLSPALGQFLSFGAYALSLKYMLDGAVIERQKEAAHDAITTMKIQQERMEEVTRRR